MTQEPEYPNLSLDDQLERLKFSVEVNGGEDFESWKAVELHHGVVYNQHRNQHADDNGVVFFCFSQSNNGGPRGSYMTVTYPTWQEAAKDYVAFATFGVRKSGANKS